MGNKPFIKPVSNNDENKLTAWVNDNNAKGVPFLRGTMKLGGQEIRVTGNFLTEKEKNYPDILWNVDEYFYKQNEQEVPDFSGGSTWLNPGNANTKVGAPDEEGITIRCAVNPRECSKLVSLDTEKKVPAIVAYNADNTRIALWGRQSSEGKPFLSGEMTQGGEKQAITGSFSMYDNTDKERSDKYPDVHIFTDEKSSENQKIASMWINENGRVNVATDTNKETLKGGINPISFSDVAQAMNSYEEERQEEEEGMSPS